MCLQAARGTSELSQTAVPVAVRIGPTTEKISGIVQISKAS